MPHFDDKAPGVTISGPSIERHRRCENCVLFDNSAAVVEDYEQRKTGEIRANAIKILDQEGVTPNRQLVQQKLTPERTAQVRGRLEKLGRGFNMSDQLVQQGLLGVCKGNHVASTYVHAYYLCDNWQQKVRPDGADKGDELPAEARERVFGKEPK